jgi:hypothetical protein
MKRRGAWLAASFLVTATTVGVAGVAPADPEHRCRGSILNGLYVFTASGFGNVSPGPPNRKPSSSSSVSTAMARRTSLEGGSV